MTSSSLVFSVRHVERYQRRWVRTDSPDVWLLRHWLTAYQIALSLKFKPSVAQQYADRTCLVEIAELVRAVTPEYDGPPWIDCPRCRTLYWRGASGPAFGCDHDWVALAVRHKRDVTVVVRRSASMARRLDGGH